MSTLFPFPPKKELYTKQFERLVRPHMDNLYRLAFRFCGTREGAEDLVQDLLIKLYSRQTELNEIDKLRPWLAKSLYRLYIDQFRRDQRSPLNYVENDVELIEQIEAPNEHPELEMQRAQQQELLLRSLSRLSDEHRALIILCDVEGYSIPEVQQVLDLPGGTVKSRLHRARARLRDMLKTKLDGTVLALDRVNN